MDMQYRLTVADDRIELERGSINIVIDRLTALPDDYISAAHAAGDRGLFDLFLSMCPTARVSVADDHHEGIEMPPSFDDEEDDDGREMLMDMILDPKNVAAGEARPEPTARTSDICLRLIEEYGPMTIHDLLKRMIPEWWDDERNAEAKSAIIRLIDSGQVMVGRGFMLEVA